jgi:L-histidine Nalpha-methyltransferase
MPDPVQVLIDASQSPEAVRRELVESLRSRKVNHKFHYDTYKQTQKWLTLHRAYSPLHNDPACERAYLESFRVVARKVGNGKVLVIGLGCGGGKKDTMLLAQLLASGGAPMYAPLDVSVPMVLVARQAASQEMPAADCYPVVCDLASAVDLDALFQAPFANRALTQNRVFTFFGMLPNFEPETVLPKLARLLRPGDYLLLSANLAPGPDYAAGVQSVLPLYDNALTRDWLMTFLLDLGVEQEDGTLEFVIEEPHSPPAIKCIAAYFQFTRDRTLYLDSDQFPFRAKDSIRLFFSLRHTPALVQEILAAAGLRLLEQWITPSGEEGVFLVTSAS